MDSAITPPRGFSPPILAPSTRFEPASKENVMIRSTPRSAAAAFALTRWPAAHARRSRRPKKSSWTSHTGAQPEGLRAGRAPGLAPPPGPGGVWGVSRRTSARRYTTRQPTRPRLSRGAQDLLQFLGEFPALRVSEIKRVVRRRRLRHRVRPRHRSPAPAPPPPPPRHRLVDHLKILPKRQGGRHCDVVQPNPEKAATRTECLRIFRARPRMFPGLLMHRQHRTRDGRIRAMTLRTSLFVCP